VKVVREAQASASDLFTQDTVLFPKIVDHVALLLFEPAGKCDQDELQGMRRRRHASDIREAEPWIWVVASIGFLDTTR